MDDLGTGIESIDKGDVVYTGSSTDADIYTHDTYRIRREDDGTYRWEDKSGNWKTFDADGRMTAHGTRTGVTAKLLYESGDNGKLIGYADRNDNQVIWIEYNGNDLSLFSSSNLYKLFIVISTLVPTSNDICYLRILSAKTSGELSACAE